MMKLNYEEKRKELAEKSNKMMVWGFMLLTLAILVMILSMMLGVIPAEKWLDVLS